MHRRIAVTFTVAAILATVAGCASAQTTFATPLCEFTAEFPRSDLTKEDDTTRTDFEATPFLSAKCFKCPNACRLRQSMEEQLRSALIAQFELKNYVLTPEKPKKNGFAISGITYKENAQTRIEARVLFGDDSILILSTVEPMAGDGSAAKAFLQSAKRRTK